MEVRLPGRGRPLGDNEPKVTRTGWCLYYCCRWLPTELDGTWPRFPWFTEVPNRVSPFEDDSRARWLHNESFYLHGTYVRPSASSSTSLLRQPLCSIVLLLDSTNSYRSAVALCKLRLRERYLIRATRHDRNARTRKIYRLLGMRETKRVSRKKECNYISRVSKISFLKKKNYTNKPNDSKILPWLFERMKELFLIIHIFAVYKLS